MWCAARHCAFESHPLRQTRSEQMIAHCGFFYTFEDEYGKGEGISRWNYIFAQFKKSWMGWWGWVPLPNSGGPKFEKIRVSQSCDVLSGGEWMR